MKRILKDSTTMPFVVCAILAAVNSGIRGNWVAVIWIVMAAVQCLIASNYRFLADDLYERCRELINDKYELALRLSELLRDKMTTNN